MVALLSFADGEEFATGRSEFDIGPASPDDFSNRILLRVLIAGIETMAVLDTGSPYVVCPPHLLRLMDLSPKDSLDHISAFQIRGRTYPGNVYQLVVSFLAAEGLTLDVEAAVFVPELMRPEEWGSLPMFIGLTGCLERMRFAVDSETQNFYFGLRN